MSTNNPGSVKVALNNMRYKCVLDLFCSCLSTDVWKVVSDSEWRQLNENLPEPRLSRRNEKFCFNRTEKKSILTAVEAYKKLWFVNLRFGDQN